MGFICFAGKEGQISNLFVEDLNKILYFIDINHIEIEVAMR
jgi:hypothetical protein